ncbi:MAG TPA: spermidine/putrescine ABC transporter substrate-binding protein, partial [Acidimicrobiia bacterium]|nr:spermidine/putrescine ABC transporter substrate-binding protein [Acidimicrobiia bacterium]
MALLASGRIDRREFLRGFGAGGVLLLGGPALLAACGDGTTNGATVGTGAGGGGVLVVDNWIEYIDLDDNGDSPTIARFTDETGIEVEYMEGVNSNEDWFGRYQPQLASGD